MKIKFKRSEFFYLLIYRFCGGIPWQLSCILPTIFNVKVKNFFCATFLGIIPQIFLAVSIGSGLEKVIEQNSTAPSVLDLLATKEVYVPLIIFAFLLVFSFLVRKIFYKK